MKRTLAENLSQMTLMRHFVWLVRCIPNAKKMVLKHNNLVAGMK